VAERTRELRVLEAEQRRLSAELGATLQRYETALRGSHVTVFTQDRDLRYISISNPLLGLGVDEVVGRTDEEILPAASRAAIIALKREVLAGGDASDGEGQHCRRRARALVRSACRAAARPRRRDHWRELRRGRCHRAQGGRGPSAPAAARAHPPFEESARGDPGDRAPTARHSDTIERFIEQFGARLQALATSHDLLVQEGWHGAGLHQLIRSQLAQHLDGRADRVTVDGRPSRCGRRRRKASVLPCTSLSATPFATGRYRMPAAECRSPGVCENHPRAAAWRSCGQSRAARR
jgi:predicted component of type VI protein secretion system